ncbi:MAG: ATP-binding cassette domain-containing protein [Tenericutes bacterium]|jgi:putative ABC transport system permease protein|nr:ATP-binding cassette domain-containing protein [Mycoplasmatota bacterium]
MLKLKNISKTYTIGEFSQNALDKVNLEFRQSEFVSVLGPSGGGKTTLLNVIGGLDHADSGDLIINGESTKSFKDKQWDMYRNNSIGFVFQSHNLISHLSVLQNVEMGLSLSGTNAQEKRKRAIEVLDKVGLKDHIHKNPNQLSGGQSQRVAIARALANNPDVILADEPTGSLDTETGTQVLDLIKEIAKEKLVIMVTHDSEMAYKYANRVINIRDGKITDDSNPIKDDIEESGTLNLKKTAMSFTTAFISSVNNIKTKLGRTILTAFAGSIGIIGIALILSLSNGMQGEIDNFERETLSSYPITIEPIFIDFLGFMEYSAEQDDLESHPSYDYITPESNIFDENTKINNINQDYTEYIDRYIANEGQETLAGYSYNYRINMSLLSEIDSEYVEIYTESSIVSGPSGFGPGDNMIPFYLQPDGLVFDDNYDLLAGEAPVNDFENKQIEVYLAISAFNQMPREYLEALGFDLDNIEENTQINFSEFVGKQVKLFVGDYDTDSDINEAYTVTVSGIIRTKENSNISLFMRNGLVYPPEVEEYLMTTYPQEIGGIQSISLYPNDFSNKDKVLTYLDNYNIGKTETNAIFYNDQAALFTSISGGIIDAISIVLIAFASISLVVSSIMISIITYVSVIERTKEIGVLRALGARKKDISRVFNTENIIIGFSAGLVGIIITLLLMIPINIILENMSDISNIAKLRPLHIISLIIISIFLAFVAGLIPARMAAKKDPVIALRTE